MDEAVKSIVNFHERRAQEGGAAATFHRRAVADIQRLERYRVAYEAATVVCPVCEGLGPLDDEHRDCPYCDEFGRVPDDGG
jgi:rubrerythrin